MKRKCFIHRNYTSDIRQALYSKPKN